MEHRQITTIAAAAAAVGVAALAYLYISRLQQKPRPPPPTALEVIAAIEKLIQKDEGGRGIHEITLQGELFNAAKELLTARKVAILTGFPCLMDHTPPTETDGPLGAFAIARALIQLGKHVTILTDECNAECILACAANSGLSGSNLQLESFPPGHEWTAKDDTRLLEIASDIDVVVAIERTGPANDRTYRTMRGFDMTRLVAPLERILHIRNTPMRSIGIGDGGNELGMGKALNKILASSIANAELIACVEPTNHLIVCSVSNWGGYALAGALAVLASEDIVLGKLFRGRASALAQCMPSDQAELEMSHRLIGAGARCGITKRCDAPYVDGMPISESLRIIHEIIAIGSA